ncbi:MAG: UDP-glucose 4-epimerase GalE [Phycisphaerales bacterium]
MNVLVTGGAGYIGSHTTARLLRDGHHILIIDNLHQGHTKAVDVLRSLAPERVSFVRADINQTDTISCAMRDSGIDAVMHFGALALVGESVERPLDYYIANVSGTASLLAACESVGVARFVFSSSCSVYGQPPESMIPVPETCPFAPMSPYARTKHMGEQLLADFAAARRRAGHEFAFVALRYFNVCGCDPEGRLGEDHTPETHLVPNVINAALGRTPHVAIFGTDYPTPDGTCIRDYVHVSDLADAHARALNVLTPTTSDAFNVGIGKGSSVREIIDAVREVSGKDFKVIEHPRRPGDPPKLWADPTKITSVLGWKAQHTELRETIATAFRWFEKHPKGYAS